MKDFKVFLRFSCFIAALVMLLTGVVSVQAATITVTANAPDVLNGANASCALREAITNINNGATTYADCPPTGAYGTSDTINIPAGTYTNALAGVEDLNATGDFDIRKSVAIVGAGSSSTTINGGGLDRVFDITGAYTVSISGVTIQNGNTGGRGGGINNIGTLTITNSTISGNTTATNWGGGINNTGTATVTNSTITGNTAGWGGGGILNNGTLTVTNSTITGNAVGTNGGGIANNGTLTVTNSTISGNTASNGGGILTSGTVTVTNTTIVRNIAPAGQGGGVFKNAGPGTFTNSIVADNGVGLDCVGAITDSGGNIDSDGNCGTFTQNTAMIQGTGFSALASNGGTTQTHALLAGSAAIDTAPTCAGLTTDQRGTARPQGSACDIGAYEYVATATTPVSVPTMNEWGMLIFMLLAGIGSMYYMRRRA